MKIRTNRHHKSNDHERLCTSHDGTPTRPAMARSASARAPTRVEKATQKELGELKEESTPMHPTEAKEMLMPGTKTTTKKKETSFTGCSDSKR